MLTVFRWQGLEHVLAEEMSALPGMEEASAFLWIEKYYEEKSYDLIVIDSAPTGETLTLLTLPQVTKWWVTKALPLQRFAIRNIGRVARVAAGIPIDKGYEELENIFDKLEKIQKVFADPAVCSIRIVTNPERMVINESKRAYTYLNLYGYNVDAVVVNRIIEEEHNAVISKYFQSQQKYLEEIEDVFAGMPVFKVHHMGEEVFGQSSLAEIGRRIYGEEDPTQIFHNEEMYQFTPSEDGYTLRIKIPHLENSSAYTLDKHGDEMVIQIGNRRKNIFLPRFVNFYVLKEHRYEAPWLVVELRK
jgi:arsenite-transporting ATPase